MNGSSSIRRLAAVSLLALLATACKPEASVPPGLPTVTASLPIKTAVTGRDVFTGRLEAVDSVEVRPRVGGYIERIAFQDGEYVKKGDLLFVIGPRPYQAAVQQAEGQLAQAQAQLVFATKELDRAVSLATSQAISASAADQRQQNRKAGEAAVTIATGALERAKLDLEFTQVRAPIDGRLSRRMVSEGNLVGGGDAGSTLLTTIISMESVDAYFDIDEESFLRYGRLAKAGKRGSTLNLGTEVIVSLPGDAGTYTGSLDFADNRLDRSTGTLRARARIANPAHQLTPGQFVRVSIVSEDSHEAILVPAVALTTNGSHFAVYTVGADDQVIAKPVKTGRLFGKFREISEGLKPDDRVVISGLQRAQPGAKVTVQTETIDPKQVALLGDAS